MMSVFHVRVVRSIVAVLVAVGVLGVRSRRKTVARTELSSR